MMPWGTSKKILTKKKHFLEGLISSLKKAEKEFKGNVDDERKLKITCLKKSIKKFKTKFQKLSFMGFL